jgi:D-3-phosphoglycerate dehydrogenase
LRYFVTNFLQILLNVMKIAILDDYQDCIRRLDCFTMLEGCAVKVFTNSARGLGQLSIRLAPFDVLVLQGTRTMLSRSLLDKLPNLKLVVLTGAGDAVDRAAANSRGIAIVDVSPEPAAVAELAFALILAARRKLVAYAGNLREGLWQASSFQPERNTPGTGLAGSTLGIWGYGRVGRRVAQFGQAFGMRILVWGSEAGRSRALTDGLDAAGSQAGFFASADVLSLHLPLLDSTRGCVRAEDLARMRDDALLVNTSHAALIEPGALEAALAAGRPAQAALDVFASEPLAPDAPWLRMENVLATPHVGGMERAALERQFRVAFQAIRDFGARAGV